MKIEDLQNMQATKTASESREVMAAMLLNSHWVAFDKTEDLLIYHIRRFLAAHCRIPGVFCDTICGAFTPLAVIRYLSNKKEIVEAAVFLNGAVVRISNGDSDEFVLFMSKEDAEFWDYPVKEQVSSLTQE